MAAPTRIVRHLRLAVASEAAARRLLPKLEDALRCASLPGDDARVLVVRKLALGRVAADIDAQALARLIERRMAEVGVTWIAGDSPAAEAADCVVFAGALEARMVLARRLLRRESCTAWYWSRAVPEFVPAARLVDNLRRIAAAIAALPDAASALPAWRAAVVRAGGANPFEPGNGRGQPRRPAAGPGREVREDLTRPSRPVAPPVAPRRAAAVDQPAQAPTQSSPQACPRRPAGKVAHRRDTPQPVTQVPGESAGDRVVVRAASPYAANGRAGADQVPAASRPRARMRALPRARPARAPVWPIPGPGAAATPRPAAAGDTLGDLLPTDCGGLLFLLPVLARLGLAQWLAPLEDSPPAFAGHVLSAALQRLRVPRDDPAWLLAAVEPAPLDLLAKAAPLRWADPLMAPPRAAAQADALSAQLASARGMDAQAAVWLTAARRWLRRAGGPGLASLVLRPAWLGLTTTHVDLHFRLADTDLRVRRLGLDIDPGWLPWFGRVVAFHFHRSGGGVS